MATKKDTDELDSQEHKIEPKPGQDDADASGAVKDPGAESTYGDRLPNHNALLPQSGEKGAPDSVTHFRVINAMVSVPHVFTNSDGSVGLTGDAKYRGDIVKREALGDEQRIAHLLGMKAIEPVKA